MKCYPIKEKNIKTVLEKLEGILEHSESFEVKNGTTVFYVCFETFENIISKVEEVSEIYDPPFIDRFSLFRTDGTRQQISLHDSKKLLETLRKQENE